MLKNYILKCVDSASNLILKNVGDFIIYSHKIKNCYEIVINDVHKYFLVANIVLSTNVKSLM